MEWLFLCRKSNSSLEVASDPYWRRSDPRFALLGTMALTKALAKSCSSTGERIEQSSTGQNLSFHPAAAPTATPLRAHEAAALYDTTFQIRCHTCHDNKSPYVVDPHAGQSRVGYLLGESDRRATRL